MIHRSHQGLRISWVGCEMCGIVGFMAFGLWIEFNFLHRCDE